jgi:hypothetical protein
MLSQIAYRETEIWAAPLSLSCRFRRRGRPVGPWDTITPALPGASVWTRNPTLTPSENQGHEETVRIPHARDVGFRTVRVLVSTLEPENRVPSEYGRCDGASSIDATRELGCILLKLRI